MILFVESMLEHVNFSLQNVDILLVSLHSRPNHNGQHSRSEYYTVSSKSSDTQSI
jgi:hypothetical protein